MIADTYEKYFKQSFVEIKNNFNFRKCKSVCDVTENRGQEKFSQPFNASEYI